MLSTSTTNVVLNIAQKLCKSIPSSDVLLQSFFMFFVYDSLPPAVGELDRPSRTPRGEETRWIGPREQSSEKKHTREGLADNPPRKITLARSLRACRRKKSYCRTLRQLPLQYQPMPLAYKS